MRWLKLSIGLYGPARLGLPGRRLRGAHRAPVVGAARPRADPAARRLRGGGVRDRGGREPDRGIL